MQWAPPAARQVRLDELAPTDRPEILAAYLHAARKRSSVCETGPVPLPPRPGGVPGRDRGGRRLLPGVPRRLPQV